MSRIREDEILQQAQNRPNQWNQRRCRCDRQGGARDRHAREDGQEDEDPKVEGSVRPVQFKFSSVQFDRIARDLPKENHHHHRDGDEQTSVAGSASRRGELRATRRPLPRG